MSRLVSMLAGQKNLVQLRRFAETFAMEHLLQRSGEKRRCVVVFDVDSLPVEAHGRQQGSKWNGYYKRTIFLPLVALCGKTSDMLVAELREGTRSVVDGCYTSIRRIAQGLRRHVTHKVIVRLDTGFNSGELCDKLESDGIGYIMRLKENAVLGRLAEPHLACRQYHELRYRAGSWSADRRVVLVMDPVPGELFARHYFLLTDQDEAACSAAQLVKLYQKKRKGAEALGRAQCGMLHGAVFGSASEEALPGPACGAAACRTGAGRRDASRERGHAAGLPPGVSAHARGTLPHARARRIPHKSDYLPGTPTQGPLRTPCTQHSHPYCRQCTCCVGALLATLLPTPLDHDSLAMLIRPSPACCPSQQAQDWANGCRMAG